MRTLTDAFIHSNNKQDKDRLYSKNDIENLDRTIPIRLVGTHEYLNAIGDLRQLLQMSTPPQIDVYNKVLATQNEFSFVSGQFFSAPTTNQNRSDKNATNSSERKHSLQWMLALARIELGATLSMYGEISEPFQFVAPKSFGRDEFLAVLQDDLAAHLVAIGNDPMFEKKSKSSAKTDGETVAYLRRLRIIEDMLRMVQTNQNPVMTPDMEDFLNLLGKAQSKLKRKVKDLPRIVKLYESENTKILKGQYVFEASTIRAASPLISSCQRAFLEKLNPNSADPVPLLEERFREIEETAEIIDE